MQRQDKRFEEILEFLMKKQEEDQKLRQEWSKISAHGFNPFAAHERTQKLLNSGYYNDRNVNRLPASILIDYNSNIKNVVPDYELQKFYLSLPDPPPTLSTRDYSHMNQSWGSSAAVWGAAIFIMGVLVFTIRAAEKCLERRLFKETRRASTEEWPTPSVIATSQQSTANGELGVSLRMDIPFQPENQDLPPPYSDCTTDADPSNVDPKYLEEPPPPYAACFVAFTAPKDGVPSVHIVTDGSQTTGTSRSDDFESGAGSNNVHEPNENNTDVVVNINNTNTREQIA